MVYPVANYYVSSPGQPISGGRTFTPAWAPDYGHLVSIGYTYHNHPLGQGAMLEEIDPKYQTWHPTYNPDLGYATTDLPFSGNGMYLWGSNGSFSGMVFNTDTRQYVGFGAGHTSVNVSAPYCYDLKDLRWKWLDTPLPFDGFQVLLDNGISPTKANTQIYYPPEQLDYDFAELKGDWSGWPEGFGRPGIIQPVTSHSRAGLCHIPASVFGNMSGALLYCLDGSGKLSGNATMGSHLFDYDTKLWSRTANKCPLLGTAGNRATVCDPVTGKVIVFMGASGSKYVVLDIATRTWSTRTATVETGVTECRGNIIHTQSRLHIAPIAMDKTGVAYNFGEYFDFWACDVDAIVGSGTFTPKKLIVNAVSTWPIKNVDYGNYSIGWQFCPLDECLYAVNGLNGSNKYWRLAPPDNASTQSDYLTGTWTLTEHTFAAGQFLSSLSVFNQPVYQRLQWDKNSRAFIWHSSSLLMPVQAWRPYAL